MHRHVQVLSGRFRSRFWVLRHLRNAGFNEEELVKVYKTILRPVADYLCVFYHSILTDEQDEQIERLQVQALKCIFGWRVPYSEMRSMAGVTTLRQRRIEMADKFAEKAAGSARFSGWFPQKQP